MKRSNKVAVLNNRKKNLPLNNVPFFVRMDIKLGNFEQWSRNAENANKSKEY